MYTVKEIASFLEVTSRAVRYQISQGYLKATVIDEQYHISSKDFSDYKKIKEMYTARDISYLLGITSSTVRNHITRGDLKAKVINGQYRVSLKDFADYKEIREMYTVKEIASFLEVTSRAVRYQISQGNLKANIVDEQYRISSKDFSDYKEHYHYSQRTKNKGKGNRPTMKKINSFIDLYNKAKEGLNLEDFIKTLTNSDLVIPTLEELERANRNFEINRDKKKGLSLDEIANKHNLSRKTIEEIVYQRQEIILITDPNYNEESEDNHK